VVETAEHRNRDDLAGVVVVHRPLRDPLPDALMRSGPVEIAGILPGKVFEVLDVKEEYVVEGLATQAANKSFTNGFMFGARTAVLMTRVPAPTATRSNVEPNFSSRSRIRNRGANPSMVAFRNCCAVHSWVGFRVAAI
jgi:hypothetical protein